MFRELLKITGVKSKLSTAYHPQTDGETERMNQEMEAYLRMFCANCPEKWPEALSDAEFVHNQRIHEARGMSPFYIMMGYNPKAIPTVYPRTNVPAAQDRIQGLQKIWDEALAAHELARRKMAGRITKNFKPFEKGQKVWLEGKNLKAGYENIKLGPKREGPFEIIDTISPIVYKLKLPPRWKIHPVFHAALLMPYVEMTEHGPNFTQPPLEKVNEEEQFEVEAIVGHRKVGKTYQYLVKWEGYPMVDNTWEPETSFEGAAETLSAYKNRHKIKLIDIHHEPTILSAKCNVPQPLPECVSPMASGYATLRRLYAQRTYLPEITGGNPGNCQWNWTVPAEQSGQGMGSSDSRYSTPQNGELLPGRNGRAPSPNRDRLDVHH